MQQTHMRAARMYGPGTALQVEFVAIPKPKQGEALLRVRAAGLCHTELHLLDGVLNPGVVPLTPGHEVVADVVEVAGTAIVAPGQRVLLYYYAPCGACRYCRGGHEQLCPFAARQFGFTADGGFAEYLTAPVTSLVPLPETLSDDEAVGLACGAATAYHAARTVADVRIGETVVVYGVGGVGLYLIQLCRLAGARVIAISRTNEKLAFAHQFGAETVNAREQEPLTAVLDRTEGNGADVVFDLVASSDTLELAPRMLARRGRLVFCGYGEAQLSLPPLWLVLRELRILGSVGNTLDELHEVVRLAEAGLLQGTTTGPFALHDLGDAIRALRSGEIVGRAVIHPGDTVSSAVGRPAQQRGDHNASTQQLPYQSMVTTRSLGAVRSAADGTAGVRPLLPDTALRLPQPERGPRKDLDDDKHEAPMATTTAHSSVLRTAAPRVVRPAPGPHPFESELLDVIGQGIDGPISERDDDFNALALGLFAYQFDQNAAYRQFCEYKRITPDAVSHWTEIPAVPIGAFKEATLSTQPVEQAVAVFMSSGTTRADVRSRHYHPSLRVYDASARTNFVAHLFPDNAVMPLLVLNPSGQAAPNSSLAHYLSLMVDAYGAEGSGHFVSNEGLQIDALLTALHAAEQGQEPICLLGATFAFVHLLDYMADRQLTFSLPTGSRVMDTGGVKGRSREITREDLTHEVERRFGVVAQRQVNMYGLTELSTQFLDATIRDATNGTLAPRHKTIPAWARTRVLDPDTLQELPEGAVGVLCHTDLANRASVCTILTEDLGVRNGRGFEIVGRVSGSQARGCSIAMDELLEATGRVTR